MVMASKWTHTLQKHFNANIMPGSRSWPECECEHGACRERDGARGWGGLWQKSDGVSGAWPDSSFVPRHTSHTIHCPHLNSNWCFPCLQVTVQRPSFWIVVMQWVFYFHLSIEASNDFNYWKKLPLIAPKCSHQHYFYTILRLES